VTIAGHLAAGLLSGRCLIPIRYRLPLTGHRAIKQPIDPTTQMRYLTAILLLPYPSIVLPREMIMKKCPFCAEDIQDDAIKCKHCGEFLIASQNPRLAEEKVEWYFRKSFIIIALCCVGPLALPLIWWHPQATRAWKIGLTIGILVFSWILFQLSIDAVQSIKAYYQLFDSL